MGNEGLGLFALIITEALEVLTQHNIRYVVLLAHDEAPDLGVVTNTHDDDATEIRSRWADETVSSS